MRETNRRPDIQGLRAVAVLMVVAFHSGLPAIGGFVGVDVFFVISGYVITGLLRREWAATGRIRFIHFYVRRFRRLTPALALMTAITVVVSILLFPLLADQNVVAKTAIGALLLCANFVIASTTGGYFDAAAESNPLLHTWSLSVEEQFYLLFPALLAVSWRLAKTRRIFNAAAFVAIAVIAIVSFGVAVVGSTGYAPPHGAALLGFYSPATRAWEFAVGALLALATDRFHGAFARHGAPLGALGAVALVASMLFISGATPFPGAWTLLPVAGAAALIAAGPDTANVATRALSRPGMVRIGDWSYSIYLWHWPCIVFAGMLWPNDSAALLIAAVVSIVPAVASYEWVEQPIRKMSDTGWRRLAALVVVVTGLPVGLATLLWLASVPALSPNEVMAARKLIAQDHLGFDRGCTSKGPFDSRSFAKCQWNEGADGMGIYLVGDSNAAQFAEAAIGAGKRLNRPVRIMTAPSCPLIANLAILWLEQSRYFPTKVNQGEFEHCSRYVAHTLRVLKQAPAGTVIIGALDQYWWDSSIGVAYEGAGVTHDAESKSALLAKGLKATVDELRSAGHRVVIVQSIPTYRNPLPIWNPRSCPLWALSAGTCSRSVPIDHVQSLQHDSRAAIEEVGRSTHSTVLDLREWFCDRQSCSTNKSGAWWYKDATHLTAMGSEALVPPFADALREADKAN